MKEIISEGNCFFCNKTFKKAGINRHVAKHFSEKAASGKPGKSYHLKVELNARWGGSGYFLVLWMDGHATMGDLDEFLRAIWLECCGHMSSFSNPKNRKNTNMFDFIHAQELLEQGKEDEYDDFMEDTEGEIPMKRTVGDCLYKGLNLEYQYDFGSTTALSVKVMGEYVIEAEQPIVLVSRNQPLAMLCDICKKEPATVVCTVCLEYEEDSFCEKCAEKHSEECDDFADYAGMPVVNSPRMGVCGYEGGRIDLERDGVYKRKE